MQQQQQIGKQPCFEEKKILIIIDEVIYRNGYCIICVSADMGDVHMHLSLNVMKNFPVETTEKFKNQDDSRIHLTGCTHGSEGRPVTTKFVK